MVTTGEPLNTETKPYVDNVVWEEQGDIFTLGNFSVGLQRI